MDGEISETHLSYPRFLAGSGQGLIDAEITSDLSDRLPGLLDQADRSLAELPANLPRFSDMTLLIVNASMVRGILGLLA